MTFIYLNRKKLLSTSFFIEFWLVGSLYSKHLHLYPAYIAGITTNKKVNATELGNNQLVFKGTLFY